MTDITIPPEAIEAAARADFEAWREYHHRSETWGDLLPEEQESYRIAARAACTAMLKSWPGMTYSQSGRISPAGLFLPLYEQDPKTADDDLKDDFGIISANRLIGPYKHQPRLHKCGNCKESFIPTTRSTWCFDCLAAEKRARKEPKDDR